MENGPESRLLLPGQQTAILIGKQGETLRGLRDSTGASLHIIEKDLPDSLRLRDERVLCLGGGATEVQAALQRISELITLDELCLLIPEAAVPHIIGTKGERIKNLMEESGCSLQVSKQPLAGVHSTRRLTIRAEKGGLWEGLRECAITLADLTKSGFLDPKHFELLDDSLPDAPKWVDGAPLRFLVDEEETCWIVGKKGNKVSKYRDICRLSVDETPCSFDDAARCVTLDPTKGPDAQRIVLQLMIDDLGVRLEQTSITRLLVPAEVAGKVSGRGEENLRNIERESKVKILAPMPTQYQPDRVFHIDGDGLARVEAIMKIQKLIQENMERKKTASVSAANLDWSTADTKKWVTPDSTRNNFSAFNSSSSFSSRTRPTNSGNTSSTADRNGRPPLGSSLYTNPTGEWRPPVSEEAKANTDSNTVETWVRGGVGKVPPGGTLPSKTANWSDRQVSAAHLSWGAEASYASKPELHASAVQSGSDWQHTAGARAIPPKSQRQPILSWSKQDGAAVNQIDSVQAPSAQFPQRQFNSVPHSVEKIQSKPSLYQNRPKVALKVLLSPDQLTIVQRNKEALEQRSQTSIGVIPGGITVTGTTVANALCTMLIQSS